jgi:hypothetical protein
VDGPVFVDAAGHTVVLRGVAVHTLDPVTYQQAPGLGVNFVRLAITWSDYEPTAPVDGVQRWDQARLADLDAEIAFFREHGIQVLLDLHQYGWSPYFATLQRGGRQRHPAMGLPRPPFPLTVAGREQARGHTPTGAPHSVTRTSRRCWPSATARRRTWSATRS